MLASLLSMNSGITSRLAIARSSACKHGDVAAGVDAGGGELVVGAGHRVEDRAGGVAAEMAGPAGGGAGDAQVGPAGDEIGQAGGRGRLVLADDGDGRLDFGHDAHVPQQLFRAAEVLADREEERQAALHVGVDVRLAVLDFVGVDQPAADPIAQHGLHVVRVGLDAEAGRGVGRRDPAARPLRPARRTAPAWCRRRPETAAESTRRRGPCGGRSPAAAGASGSGGRTRRRRLARPAAATRRRPGPCGRPPDRRARCRRCS